MPNPGQRIIGSIETGFIVIVARTTDQASIVGKGPAVIGAVETGRVAFASHFYLVGAMWAAVEEDPHLAIGAACDEERHFCIGKGLEIAVAGNFALMGDGVPFRPTKDALYFPFIEVWTGIQFLRNMIDFRRPFKIQIIITT